MPTFTGSSDVVYKGNPTVGPDGLQRGHLARYFWNFSISGNYVYKNNKRYLRITSVSVKLSWTGRNGPGYTEYTPNHGVYLVYNYPGAPGTITVRVSSRVTNYGSTTDTQVFYINGGGGLELKQLPLWPINYTETTGVKTWTGTRDILLPNKGGLFNVYVTTSKCEQYNDWGNIGSNKYPSWDPNVPGVQYYTNSGWKTHRIKRWNGSSWVNIPGRRWNRSSWEEVRG